MEKKLHLSDKQKEVIKLMRKDWNLGEDIYAEKIRMQEGGLGYGGESKNINRNTFNSLVSHKLIAFYLMRSYPTNEFHLTELGKTIEI